MTPLNVSIAIATISIILRGRRWPWCSAMVLGALGTLTAGIAYR